MSVDGADLSVELKAGKRRSLDSLSLVVVVTNSSYVECSFVTFNGFTAKKRVTAEISGYNSPKLNCVDCGATLSRRG